VPSGGEQLWLPRTDTACHASTTYNYDNDYTNWLLTTELPRIAGAANRLAEALLHRGFLVNFRHDRVLIHAGVQSPEERAARADAGRERRARNQGAVAADEVFLALSRTDSAREPADDGGRLFFSRSVTINSDKASSNSESPKELCAFIGVGQE
jgi:hypothetical protein